jgi:hypothetical protein
MQGICLSQGASRIDIQGICLSGIVPFSDRPAGQRFRNQARRVLLEERQIPWTSRNLDRQERQIPWLSHATSSESVFSCMVEATFDRPKG